MQQSRGNRLLIVANRLPITVTMQDGNMELVDSPGGVATGLRQAYLASGGLWIGWPGEIARLSAADRQRLEAELSRRSIVPVFLTAQEVRQYYETFANGVIWPLFHYLLERMPLDQRGWEVYRRVNEKFADVVAGIHQPGDVVWVHDYQLMLVPAMLRQRIPDARIGFFLHIPFPAPEVFRILPWRAAVLEGLLGADLVGFHTGTYVRHFATTLRYVMGLQADLRRALFDGREIKLDVFPMGIDVAEFERLAASEAACHESAQVRADSQGRRILLGVDRLDYTKGIPRRMLAFERLLDRHPEWRDRVRFIQVAVPSRTSLEPYQAFRRQLDELIGRINATHGTLTSVPVHYLYRSIPPEQLVALYRAADVMVVTPLRDGMNLVAKEFVASRLDEDGVLVLSEFAGAAAELGEALLVNPYDVDGTAEAMDRALRMSEQERRTRMRALRERVRMQTVQQWVASFVEELHAPPRPRQVTAASEIDELVSRIRAASCITLLLDYDGTLVPIVGGPALAVPDEALLRLLAQLGATPRFSVHLVSGRLKETMESWFGSLPIGLWAEHGLWHRLPNQPWTMTLDVDQSWIERVRPVLEEFTRSTSGSLIEPKTASFAWHYRMVDPDVGEQRAAELREALREAVGDAPVEILNGSKVIEIRPQGVTKGLVVQRLLSGSSRCAVVAMGDDRTDEDMFAALPPHGISVHVGPLPSRARVRLTDWRAARDFLRRLA
ncbi:MAG TPA: bifunctional alpha,alpha-trehalose-phosphate synthase (UDP-forming)/trehalose-phosphatase [Vicinamibacterales bacterium]|nr:bifunctional alpha,alpha-trehalose-phosphate synthase (UDP-forming)/trehalose-phosphatase [Vicinamibacterales bacterium]